MRSLTKRSITLQNPLKFNAEFGMRNSELSLLHIFVVPNREAVFGTYFCRVYRITKRPRFHLSDKIVGVRLFHDALRRGTGKQLPAEILP